MEKRSDDRNKALSARNNVVHQFEKVTLWKTLVTATPWNYDYLLYKNHMLLLVTSETCETCKQASEGFVGSERGCEL